MILQRARVIRIQRAALRLQGQGADRALYFKIHQVRFCVPSRGILLILEEQIPQLRLAGPERRHHRRCLRLISEREQASFCSMAALWPAGSYGFGYPVASLPIIRFS